MKTLARLVRWMGIRDRQAERRERSIPLEENLVLFYVFGNDSGKSFGGELELGGINVGIVDGAILFFRHGVGM